MGLFYGKGKSKVTTTTDPSGDTLVTFYLRLAEHDLDNAISDLVKGEISEQMESAAKSILGSIIKKQLVAELKKKA